MNFTTEERYKALVDWLDIEVESLRQTNFQTVQDTFFKATGKRLHVTAIMPGKGGESRWFRVRIHDPQSYQRLERIHSQTSAILPMMPYFKIVRIEVAIDIYCANLADRVARHYKFLKNPVSDNCRLYWDFKGSGKAVPNRFSSFVRHLADGYHYAIGNKDDDRYQCGYVKIDDTINGKRVAVEPRARNEVRLGGGSLMSALPYQTAEGWRNCKFERLTGYFHQRKMLDNLNLPTQTMADALDQIGERRARKRRDGGGDSLYSRATVADTITNRKIKQALANLSARWSHTSKHRRLLKDASMHAEGMWAAQKGWKFSDQVAENKENTVPSLFTVYTQENTNVSINKVNNDTDTALTQDHQSPTH